MTVHGPQGLTQSMLDTAFPAHLQVDANLRVIGFGPGARAVWPDIVAGACLTELLRPLVPDGPLSFAGFTRDPGLPWVFETHGGAHIVSGPVAHADDHTTLTLLVTASPTQGSTVRGQMPSTRELGPGAASHVALADAQAATHRLQAQLEHYHRAIDSVREVIFETDAETRWTYLNPAWTDLTGFDIHQCLGTRVMDYLHPDDRHLFHGLRTGGEQRPTWLDYEARCRSATGDYRWVSVRARIVRDDNGALAEVYGTLNDLQERRDAETALKTVEARLGLIIDSLPIILFALDGDARFTLSLGRSLQALNRAPGSAVGSLITDVYPPDHPVVDCVQRALQGQDVDRIVVVNGSSFSARYVPIRDAAGHVVGVTGVAIDLTGLQRTTDALAASERRFRALVQQAPVAIFEADAAGDWTFVNTRARAILGLADDDPPAAAWLASVHHDDRPAVSHAWQATIATGVAFEREFRYLRPDGSTAWIVGSASRLPSQYGSAGFLGTLMDVTDRKRLELALADNVTRLNAVLRTAADGVITIDERGTIELFNPAAERMFGYAADEVVGGNVTMLMLPEDASRHRTQLGSYLVTGIRRVIGHSTEVIGVRKDGTTLPVLLSVSETRLERQRLFTSIVRDITDLKQAESELAVARDMALEASRLKSEFLATMSHEIRTPMNGVLGMLEILRDTALSSEQLEYVEVARSSAEALLTIINDILDFSKIEAGRLDLEATDVSPAELVERAAEVFGPAAAAKRVVVSTDIAPDLPDFVHLDGGRLRQILLNLIGNAVKFTDRGEVSVSLAAEAAAEGVLLRVTVTDTGVGISPEERERLFTPFTQMDGSMARRHGGTGLGLAICYRLVELMGGEIGHADNPNGGSIFWFTARSALSRFVEDTMSLGVDRQLQGHRVLVVDTAERARAALAATLERAGMEAVVATTASDAVRVIGEEQARGRPFSLVVVDTLHPDSEPQPVLDACWPSAAGPAALMLVGPASANDALGARRTLARPFTRQALVAATSAALARPTTTSPQPALQPSTRILVAEDDPTNRQILGFYLQRLGYSADLVGSGAEAVRAAEARPYGVILMDLLMPEVDGLEATRRIREAEGKTASHTPIVGLTASALVRVESRCRAAGMDGVLTKPVTPESLGTTVRRWLTAPVSAS